MKRLLLLFIPLLFTGCQKVDEDKRPVLSVSIEPLRYFVECIAGEKYRITTLVPSGASPETYQPTPQQMIDLSESKAYFRIGTLGFELTRLEEMTKAAPGIELFDTSRGLTLMPHSACCEAHGEYDQHTWMSVRNVRGILRNICSALCALDSTDTHYYEERLLATDIRLDSLDKAIREKLAGLKQHDFLIFHPALGYYAQEYGLHQHNIPHAGKEPAPQQVAELIKWAKEAEVHTVFIQKEHAGRAARHIAEEIGAEVVKINPLAYEWAAQMLRIAQKFAENDSIDRNSTR